MKWIQVNNTKVIPCRKVGKIFIDRNKVVIAYDDGAHHLACDDGDSAKELFEALVSFLDHGEGVFYHTPGGSY